MGDDVIEITIDTNALLADLVISTDLVEAALMRAGADAIDVLGPAILAHTPEISGDLKRSEKLVQDDPYLVSFEAGMVYASNVEAIRHYLENGVDDSRAQVDAIYDAEFDELAQTFGSGQ